MYRFDGSNDEEAQLWHSYMRIARDHVVESGAKPLTTKPPKIQNETLVWPTVAREAIQTILFAAFILEARLKRVLREMGRPPRAVDGPNNVLSKFWPALSSVNQIGTGLPCSRPAEWSQIESKLNELRHLRNLMAHGNLSAVLASLPSENAHLKARALYNAVMKAILLINLATGYETRNSDEAWSEFEPLLMRE